MPLFLGGAMSKIYLPIGSVTGTAIAVGRAMADKLTELGHEVIIDEKPSFAAMQEAAADAILICTATTGSGDLPANIGQFYNELQLNFPMQDGRPFGVVSLGDSSYDDTFCFAGIMFEELFLELQGKQTVPRVTIDAIETATPDDDALFWLDEWVTTTFA